MRHGLLGTVLGFGVVLWALASRPAGATYSVMLTNTRTRELGVAVASCVGPFDLSNVFASVQLNSVDGTHRTGVLAQARVTPGNKLQAIAWLAQGYSQAQVLDLLQQPEFDPEFAQRQYELLSTNGSALAWTGGETLPFAGDTVGTAAEYAFTAAGNLLTSERVLSLLISSLQSEIRADEPIEERLMRALEAVALEDEGDQRCTPLPADSAFLQVLDDQGTVRLNLSVTDTAPESAVQRLRQALEALVEWDVSPSGPRDDLVDAAGPEVQAPEERGEEGASAAHNPSAVACGECHVGHTSASFGARGLWILVCLLIVRRRASTKQRVA